MSDELAEDLDDLQGAAKKLRQIAWLAGEFYEALKGVKLPDDVAGDLVRDWNVAMWDQGGQIEEEDDV